MTAAVGVAAIAAWPSRPFAAPASAGSDASTSAPAAVQRRTLAVDAAARAQRAVWPQPGFMLDAGRGLAVDYVLGIAQTRDGSVWIGGMTGLQRYDGVRLYDAGPQHRHGGAAAGGPRVDVQLFDEDGRGLLFNWGNVLVLRDLGGAPDRVSRVGGPGWQAAAEFDWRKAGQLVGSHCRLEDGSVLQVRWGRDAALMRMDRASGRWQAVAGFDGAHPATSASALRCSGDWAYWIESAPRPRAVALNLRDGRSEELPAPQSLARAVVDLPQNQDYAALLGGRRLLVGQADSLYVADFEHRRSGEDLELTRRVRRLLPDEVEGGSFRVIEDSDRSRVWITRSGSRAVHYRWSEPQRLEVIDTSMMSGRGIAGQTYIRKLVETRHGTSRTLWVGRGDWVQAISLAEPVVARSGRPHPDERGDASDELISLCMDGEGTLWLGDIQGHLWLVQARAAGALRRVRGAQSVSSLSCDGAHDAWWLEGDVLIHGRRNGEDRIDTWSYTLPPGRTRGTDILTRLDANTLAVVRPDRIVRIEFDDTGSMRVSTQSIALNSAVRFHSAGRRGPVALVVAHDAPRIDIYRGADERLTPVEIMPPLHGPQWDGTWLSERRAVVVKRDGSGQLLEFSPDLRSARSRPLTDASSLGTRKLYDVVGDAASGVWGSTTDGLVRLDLERRTWEPLGHSRGVAWSDYNYHAAWMDPQNRRLAFGALEGWTLVDLDRYRVSAGAPRVVLDRAAAGRAEMQGVAGAFAFDESDGLLHVQAAVVGDAVLRPALLEYRIDGVDPGWRRIAPASPIEYAGLGAGRYELQARFVSDGGALGEIGRLSIEVRPPWWRTTPAHAAYALAGLALAWAAWRRRRLAHERQLSHYRRIEHSEQRLSLALKASASVLWDEVDGVAVRTDAAWLGYDGAELSGAAARFEALIHPEDLDRCRQARGQCREGRLHEMQLEYRLRHRDGRWIWVQDVGRMITAQTGSVRLTGTFHEISRIKSIEEELRSMAYEDGLTRLPNRRECYRHVDLALGQGGEAAVQRLAVVFMDLDRFKHINDSMGHAFGDRLLVQVAAALGRCLPPGAVAYRLGGDEFVILMRELSEADVAALAQDVLGAVRAVNEIDGVELNISASLGVALYPDHARERKDLLQYADAAMYVAKQAGRNTVKFFDPGSAAALIERPHIEAALRQAVDRGEFELEYQPKIAVGEGRCVGFEALLRWRNPRFGHVGLGRTIAVLESCGLIDGVGQWVLRRACEDLRRCDAAMAAGATVAVNVSVRQLARPGFARKVLRQLAECGLAPARLEVELTESIFAAGDPLVIEQLRLLRAQGVKVAIDDFGMGYSSLSYLGSLPIDVIKIDKFFVDRIDGDRRAADLCRAIVALAASLELEVVAEGVERVEQAERLAAMACDRMQGFLFSRPCGAADIASWFGDGATARFALPRRDDGGRRLRLVTGD